ncbi:hypothetical protein CR513_15668, partial [Mucuna pruriens]
MVTIVQLGFHPMFEQFWTNIELLPIFKIRGYIATMFGEWVNDKTRELALKYEQRRQEVQKSTTEEASSANDSNSVPINDNDIYLEVVGGKNEKGNVYGLGKLTHKFMRSTRIPTNLINMLMVQQMEEMHETIYKMNNELEKSLEEKVVQLLHNHEEQTEQIRRQNEKMEQQHKKNRTTT